MIESLYLCILALKQKFSIFAKKELTRIKVYTLKLNVGKESEVSNLPIIKDSCFISFWFLQTPGFFCACLTRTQGSI